MTSYTSIKRFPSLRNILYLWILVNISSSLITDMSSPLPRSLQGDASPRPPGIHSTFTWFFNSYSNYGLNLAGPWGLFLKVIIRVAGFSKTSEIQHNPLLYQCPCRHKKNPVQPDTAGLRISEKGPGHPCHPVTYAVHCITGDQI